MIAKYQKLILRLKTVMMLRFRLELKIPSSDGNMTLNLTNTQVKKLDGVGDKQVRLKLSKTQLKAGGKKTVKETSKKLSLAVTPSDMNKIDAEAMKLKHLTDLSESDIQDGSGLGSLFKLALPFVKKILPKVLGTLGLAAASGAVSGATHKATKGKGIQRAEQVEILI